MAMQRNLVVALVLALVTVASGKVHMTFKAGPHETIGLYYVGNETMKKQDWSEKDFEVLSNVLKPEQSVTMDLPFEHAFVLRSSDHQFRAKVKINKNPEDSSRDVHPYLIAIRNIMHESPQKMISLEHTAVSGKIEPGKEVGYYTDISHWYEISMNDELMFAVQLGHAASDEL
jgi:stalled ribosome rescue protein Dom34